MAKKPRKQQPQSGGTPATVALTAAGVPYEVHAYDHDPAHPSYGEEAAEAMGVSPDRVFKTLVADVDGALTVAVVPVAGQLDLKALAAAVGGKRAAMADPALAERTTGYVRGGISPSASARSSARSSTTRPPPTPRSASRRAAAAWRSNSPPNTWQPSPQRYWPPSAVRDPSTPAPSSVKHKGHVEENQETKVAHQKTPLEPWTPAGVGKSGQL